MKYILALDQGTTSSRALIFDKTGKPVALAQKEHRQIYPQAGWVEHDAEEIWANQLRVALDAMASAKLTARDIAAIGITNQRETCLLWERKTGRPLGHAIVWQDRRTADACAALKAGNHEAFFNERTGLLLDPYFSGTKLTWMLDNIERARTCADNGELAFGTIDSWLIWKLTNGGIHATDATNASRTLLMNLHTCAWDDDCLRLLNIPKNILPAIVESSGVIGEVSFPGELAGIPIAGIAGDQHAALFGQACFEKGMAKNTYGTGCFLLMQTGTKPVRSKNNLLTTVAWKMNGVTEYALEGSVFMGGAVVQWLRDELQMVRTAQECDELAATVPDSNGLFLVPAFTGLGAPHWDPYARGAVFGMTRGTNRTHFCRAALESIALQSADLIHCMEMDAGIPLKELRVDGGAARSELLMQLQADILNSSVVLPECVETTALGAAYLAGLAVGVWKTKEEISHQWSVNARFEPKGDPHKLGQLQQGWQRAVERSKSWIEPMP